MSLYRESIALKTSPNPEFSAPEPTAPESLAPESLAPDPPVSAAEPSAHGIRSWFKEFFATFLTIFAAEFGDKTQLATLMMTAESHSPWVVFAGAASALVMTSLVGVLVGRWLARHIPEKTLEILTGASLLVIALLLLWDAVRVS
ncbi:TMEM165/GDT1 family protein [Lyngbya confervoides]|uniref:GDT1 family protein n=1 Tax=Lyngbya confervoides BDU141951 TaxID=1574623 RepID=A0ABD4T753_9CYAN|nr:TMEM165/GDT1 family protein [Lyngbya confervoides]MCM1984289.1 TMEM165/GDT1 family protein [Lyngbya confervoides BDU141951]